LPVLAHPYLKTGQRVRITSGVLAGSEGVLLAGRKNGDLFVVSIDLLQRSVAVQIDASMVAAA
jgi:transcription antitermination factor NusG